MPPAAWLRQAAARLRRHRSLRHQAVWSPLTTTLSDTLERKTLFDLEARHIKTVIAKQTDANACDKSPMRTEIDGWYVDLPKSASAANTPASRPESPPAAGECRDRVEMRVVGDVSLGFPVKTVITTTTGEANKQETTEHRRSDVARRHQAGRLALRDPV
jgi:hypothetical protein